MLTCRQVHIFIYMASYLSISVCRSNLNDWLSVSRPRVCKAWWTNVFIFAARSITCSTIQLFKQPTQIQLLFTSSCNLSGIKDAYPPTYMFGAIKDNSTIMRKGGSEWRLSATKVCIYLWQQTKCILISDTNFGDECEVENTTIYVTWIGAIEICIEKAYVTTTTLHVCLSAICLCGFLWTQKHCSFRLHRYCRHKSTQTDTQQTDIPD